MELVLTILLWLLGVVFLLAGAMKALMPAERLTANPNMAWIERHSMAEARIAGWSEIAAALALVGAALDVTPVWLAGVAAIGIVVVMTLAVIRVHMPVDEPIAPPAALGTLAAVTAVLSFLVGDA